MTHNNHKPPNQQPQPTTGPFNQHQSPSRHRSSTTQLGLYHNIGARCSNKTYLESRPPCYSQPQP
eukprot:scaffold61211_cov76-Cyclotella_meneghiniana.AAC.2